MQDILNSFEVWSDAQGIKSKLRVRSIENISLEGIARLRELILELAIQGKLVKQDSGDEPAKELLRKIKLENEKLAKEGKQRNIKPLPSVQETEVPFSLPSGWLFVRLNEIGEWGSGATPSRSNHNYYGGDIPWFKSGELSSDYIGESEEHVTELALKEASLRYNKVGDVLLAMYGATIGKSSIVKVRSTTNQAVCACTPSRGIENSFLLTLLKAYRSRFTNMGAGGAQPNISREKIIGTVVPLPPTNEQKRIVAKVNELMALCDKLEAQKTNHLKTHQLLVKSLLQTLTQAADAAELQSAWQRLAPHFDTLFCTEDSIEQLKQTILQLAVMGKLVKQDAKDEPAFVFLKKLKDEKKAKDKASEFITVTSEDNIPFQIPSTWEWTYLENTSSDIHYGFNASADELNKEIRLLRITDIQDDIVDWNSVPGCVININQIPKYLLENGDILIARTGGTIGKSYLVSNLKLKSVFASYLIRVKKLPSSYSDFIKIYLKSECYWTQLHASSMGTGQPNVNGTSLKKLLIPIPPLAEQKRIVAKVEELFALCDALKSKLAKAQEIQATLAEAVVGAAVSSGLPAGKAGSGVERSVSGVVSSSSPDARKDVSRVVSSSLPAGKAGSGVERSVSGVVSSSSPDARKDVSRTDIGDEEELGLVAEGKVKYGKRG